MIKIRDENGVVVSLPTLKGSNGKSAYQYAVEAGYVGTEQEFINLLITGTDIINDHLLDSNSHSDIRESIQEVTDKVTILQEEINNVDVSEDISAHNTSETSHNDIRSLITGLTNRLNILADSDDTTLDQLSEIVTYIKSNRELIESVTTVKVNVSDIIDNLETNISNKPLSAAQGVIIKSLINALQAELNSHISNTDSHITSTERTNWNAAKTHADSDHAPVNAQVNVIETIKVNGEVLTPESKAVDITVPTNNNQLENGAGYITSDGTAKTISDILPISKGGTGQTTGEEAANVLINSLSTSISVPQDDDYFISQYAGGGTENTSYFRRTFSTLLSYIKSKLSAVATSGSYNDLSDKPTIPTVGNGTITITQNGTSKGTFTTNQSGDTTIDITDTNTTYGNMSGATSSSAGTAGLVPAPEAGANTKYLKGDGTWGVPTDTVYTHPTYTAKSSGLYKVTVDGTGHVSDATAVTKSDITALGIPSSDTDTHYTSKNVVGSSTATSNTSSALTNGNVYLNSVENGSVTSTHKISGSGATTVTTDDSGNIIINSTNNNTTYSAGTGLSLSGTTINHKNSITAGTAKGDEGKTLSFGGTFSIPTVSYDEQGHITSKGTTVMIMPDAPTSVSNAETATKLSTSTAGSSTQPVYFSDGSPVATTYKLEKSVPSDAVFTDTVYTHPTTAGNKHIPSGGTSGQILKWSDDGAAYWGDAPASLSYTDVTKVSDPENSITADMVLGLNEIAKTGIVKITDDTTNEVYILGIDSGKLYIKKEE